MAQVLKWLHLLLVLCYLNELLEFLLNEYAVAFKLMLLHSCFPLLLEIRIPAHHSVLTIIINFKFILIHFFSLLQNVFYLFD
jgi:hypothetical protein